MSLRRVSVVLACAGVVAGSGCGLIMRAARGELTPVGVDALDAGGIAQREGVLAESDDATEVAQAFADLTSAYLYKCMEHPTKVPTQGNQELRKTAGRALVGAMHRRVARKPLSGDVVIDDRIAALRKDMQKKCSSESNVAKQDPDGWFGQAAEIASAKGHEAYAKRVAGTIEPELEEAIGGDASAVRRWVDQTCASVLPAAEYCAPRAGEVLVAKGRVDVLVVQLVGRSEEKDIDALFVALGRRIGEAKLIETLQTFMLGGETPLPGLESALDRTAEFLRAHEAWGDCAAHTAMWRRTIASGDGVAASWALSSIVTDRCKNGDDLVIGALGSDKPLVREQAAWAVGELRLQRAKKHVERLQWSDPYMDQNCWCHPVRDAAKQAINKLELAG